MPAAAVLSLRNQYGQALQQQQMQPGDRQTDWDIRQLPSGMYFMEIRQDGQTPQVLRVVKSN